MSNQILSLEISAKEYRHSNLNVQSANLKLLRSSEVFPEKDQKLEFIGYSQATLAPCKI